MKKKDDGRGGLSIRPKATASIKRNGESRRSTRIQERGLFLRRGKRKTIRRKKWAGEKRELEEFLL